MKHTAYIAIFLLLYPSFYPLIGAKKKKAPQDQLVEQAVKNNNKATKKKGKQWNPELQHFEVKTNSPQTEQGSSNESSSATSTPDVSLSSSGENFGGNSKGGSGSGGNRSLGSVPSGDAGSKPAGEDSPERQLPPNKQGGNAEGSSEGQSFGLWWPVCVFVDGPDANKQIAEMVKMSADCRVNLIPYVRTVTVPDPNNPEQLNSLQSQSCNIKEAGIAGKGSSLVLTNRSSTVADKMCGSTEPDGKGGTKTSTNVAGCNQLANGASGKAKTRAEGHKGNGDGFGGMANGEVAVGIVDSEGYTSGAVYSHETMGHGQMGWPNGKKAGNGIGDPNDDKDSSGEHKHGGGYTGIGCAQMRASAIADPEGYHKYYASKTKYYSHRPDHPMPLGEQIWKTYKDGPKTNGQLAKNNGGSPRGAESESSGPGPDLGTAGPGHKNPNGLAGGKSSDRKGARIGDSASSTKKRTGGAASGRGDDSGSDPLANQMQGGGGGSGLDNNIIVGNRDKSALSQPEKGENSSGNGGSGNGSSAMDSNYLDGFNSVNAVEGADSVDSRITLNTKSGDQSQMDPEFFKDRKKARQERKRRTRGEGRRQGTVRRTASSEDPLQERSPASRR